MHKIDLAPLSRHLMAFARPQTTHTKVILVRNAESQGNLAGTITGWMDCPLTDFGRKQAFKLSSVLANTRFNEVYSSDLRRSQDTCFYGLAFESENVMHTPLLREINFGMHEGLHFDNLPDSEKARFADPDFQAVEGESWKDVGKRTQDFMKKLNKGTHLCFTHGGLITNYLQAHGFTEMPPNCSVIGIEVNEIGQAEKLEFHWEFPYVEEDI